MMRHMFTLRLPDRHIYTVLAAMILLLAVVPLLHPQPNAEPALAPPLLAQVVVIDAGHGGWDPGMVGSNCAEKDINLAVAKILAELCNAAGAIPVLTREEDIALGASKHEDLAERIDYAQEQGADIFISLHCNSFVSGPSQHGAQLFYQRDNAEGRLLAETIQAQLINDLGNTDRTALPHAGSFLLKNLPLPAVICEMGFLSNADEQALLNDEDYQWQLAWSIFVGINEYLGVDTQQSADH